MVTCKRQNVGFVLYEYNKETYIIMYVYYFNHTIWVKFWLYDFIKCVCKFTFKFTFNIHCLWFKTLRSTFYLIYNFKVYSPYKIKIHWTKLVTNCIFLGQCSDQLLVFLSWIEGQVWVLLVSSKPVLQELGKACLQISTHR